MSKKITKEDILAALSKIDAPKSETNIVEAGVVKDLQVTDDAIEFGLLADPSAPNLNGAVAMSAKVALKVAGWEGAIRIRSVQPTETSQGEAPASRAPGGPQGPPPGGPSPGQVTKTRGGGLPIVGQSTGSSGAVVPPVRGPRGLPIVGNNAPQAAPGGPRPGTPQTGGSPVDKKPVPGVKYIIAIASAKGGVGKSTVSSNLACALVQQGYKVGFIDNDVYGPSAPIMFGITQEPGVQKRKLIPIEKYGLKIMSLGFLLGEGSPVIWRGPIVLQVTNQLFFDVEWGDLDYLICDLPPGTGDVQLTIAQKVPVTGAVIVTTPQDVALADVERGIKMFNRVDVPILGVVENMSDFVCPSCSTSTPIFGSGGGRKKAKDFQVDFLGEIPFVPAVREAGDQGKPVVLTDPKGIPGQAFTALAKSVVEAVNEEASDKKEGGLSKLTRRILKVVR